MTSEAKTQLVIFWDDYPPSTTNIYNVSGNANSVDRWPTYIGEESSTSPTTTIEEAGIEVLMLIAVPMSIVAILIFVAILRRR